MNKRGDEHAVLKMITRSIHPSIIVQIGEQLIYNLIRRANEICSLSY